MANLRPVLIIGLLFLGYMIWVQWQRDYGPAPAAPTPAATQQATGDEKEKPHGGTDLVLFHRALPEGLRGITRECSHRSGDTLLLEPCCGDANQT